MGGTSGAACRDGGRFIALEESRGVPRGAPIEARPPSEARGAVPGATPSEFLPAAGVGVAPPMEARAIRVGFGVVVLADSRFVGETEPARGGDGWDVDGRRSSTSSRLRGCTFCNGRKSPHCGGQAKYWTLLLMLSAVLLSVRKSSSLTLARCHHSFPARRTGRPARRQPTCPTCPRRRRRTGVCPS